MRDHSTMMLAVVICSAMAFSSAGCNKTTTSDPDLVTAAGQCADAVMAHDIEGIIDLSSDSFSEEDQERWERILDFEPGTVYNLSESRSIQAIANTMTFEVNAASATVNDDGSASVAVDFTMADYRSVLDQDISSILDFEDSVAKASTENITAGFTFEKDGDRWLCTNYDVVLETIYDFTNEKYDFNVPLSEYEAGGVWVGEDANDVLESPEITVQNSKSICCYVSFEVEDDEYIDYSGIYVVVTHNGEELLRVEDSFLNYSTSVPGAPSDPSGCYLEEGDYIFTFYDAEDNEIWSGTATNEIVDIDLTFAIEGLDPEYVNPYEILFDLTWTGEFDIAQCYFTLEHEGEVVYTEYGNQYVWIFSSDCDSSVLDPTGSYLIEGDYTVIFYDSGDNVLISQTFTVHDM